MLTLKDMVEEIEISYDGVNKSYKILYISNDQAKFFTPESADNLIKEFGIDKYDIVVRLDSDFLKSNMTVNENAMKESKFPIDDEKYVTEIEDAEKKMMLFLTNSLLKTIGSSKALILINSIN